MSFFLFIGCKSWRKPRSFLVHKPSYSYLYPYLPQENLPFLSFVCREYENTADTHSALSQNLEATTGN